jgi:hypothetical protein
MQDELPSQAIDKGKSFSINVNSHRQACQKELSKKPVNIPSTRLHLSARGGILSPPDRGRFRSFPARIRLFVDALPIERPQVPQDVGSSRRCGRKPPGVIVIRQRLRHSNE